MTTAELRELLAKASMSATTRAAVNELLDAADERDALRARLDAAPVGKFEDVVAHVAYIRFEDSDSPRQYDGKRVALVELPAPPVAGGGEQSKGEES